MSKIEKKSIEYFHPVRTGRVMLCVPIGSVIRGCAYKEKGKIKEMAIIHIIAFFLCLFLLSYLWKESLVEVFPVLVCMLALALYALALLRRLSLIDTIDPVIIAAVGIWFVSRKKEQRAAFAKSCLQNMTHPSFITAVFLILAVVLCTSQKVVTWWDDINFWATDVKSLYYLDGFAAKYGNVAPEFGDYPPGAQLIKWWFLHLDPYTFRENLAFAGYYVMNIAFMLPLLRNLKSKNVFLLCGMAAALWFLPSVAEVYGYDGFCADLTMACIYGGFLFAVTDREKKADSFYYGRLMLYLSVLVLIKSVGFIWAFLGIVFFGLYRWMDRRPQECRVGSLEGFNARSQEERCARNPEERREGSQEAWRQENREVWWKENQEAQQQESRRICAREWRSAASVCALPLLTGGSWLVFCFLMRRVTKTTATAVKYMTTDEYGISGYTGDYAKAFLKAFVSSPLHKEKSLALDLTPLGFYLCICLLVIFFFHKDLMPRKLGRLVLWYSIISGALFYGIIFIAHITIFATETQYLEASGMISSIERYGAPFTIGTLLFLSNIWMAYGDALFENARVSWVKKYGVCLCFLAAIALTAGWKRGYDGLIGYREDVAAHLAEREKMTDEDAEAFLQALYALGVKDSARVCYVQRDDAPRWVRNSYTNLEASPISVVYKSVNLDDALTDWMAQEIRDTHAVYLYVENTDADAAAVFGPMMTEDSDSISDVFSCGVLYRIEDNGAQMRLTPVE